MPGVGSIDSSFVEQIPNVVSSGTLDATGSADSAMGAAFTWTQEHFDQVMTLGVSIEITLIFVCAVVCIIAGVLLALMLAKRW